MEQEAVKCSRCGSNNIDYFLGAIRAADEIPCKYYRCFDCQYGWKQSLRTPNV